MLDLESRIEIARLEHEARVRQAHWREQLAQARYPVAVDGRRAWRHGAWSWARPRLHWRRGSELAEPSMLKRPQ